MKEIAAVVKRLKLAPIDDAPERWHNWLTFSQNNSQFLNSSNVSFYFDP